MSEQELREALAFLEAEAAYLDIDGRIVAGHVMADRLRKPMALLRAARDAHVEPLDVETLAEALRTVAPGQMWPVRGVHEISDSAFALTLSVEYARLRAEATPDE